MLHSGRLSVPVAQCLQPAAWLNSEATGWYYPVTADVNYPKQRHVFICASPEPQLPHLSVEYQLHGAVGKAVEPAPSSAPGMQWVSHKCSLFLLPPAFTSSTTTVLTFQLT